MYTNTGHIGNYVIYNKYTITIHMYDNITQIIIFIFIQVVDIIMK